MEKSAVLRLIMSNVRLIEIVARPIGDGVPDWVLDSWMGLQLAGLLIENVYGVLNIEDQKKWIKPDDKKGDFWVPAKAAITKLATQNEPAADWWLTKCQKEDVTWLSFDKNSYKILPIDESSEILSEEITKIPEIIQAELVKFDGEVLEIQNTELPSGT